MTPTFLITDFEPPLAISLPETYAILKAANLVIHPAVSRIVLHGSRGLARRFRPKSDIDLSLIVDLAQDQNLENQLRDVTQTTLDHWQAPIELDLAVIFDLTNCGLKCFELTTWDPGLCRTGARIVLAYTRLKRGSTVWSPTQASRSG